MENEKNQSGAAGAALAEAEEDDFDFGKGEGEEGGEGSEGKGSEEKNENESAEENGEESGDGSDSGDSGSQDGDEAEGSQGDGEAAEGKSGDNSSEESSEGEDEKGKKGEGESQSKEADDFFSEGFKESGEEQEQESAFDFKTIAPELDVELEKGTKEEFTQKVKEKIEASRQEFKLDDYSPDAQMVIKFLNDHNGKIDDLFTNEKVVQLQGVMGLSPEDRVMSVRIGELTSAGLDREKATEQASAEIEELSTKEIKDIADGINEDASKLIQEEVKKIFGDREKIATQQKAKSEQQIQREVGELKNYVNSQESFMGIPITTEAKKNIVRAIDSGEFDDVTDKNPAESKFAAYMLARFGKKIAENIKAEMSEQNRKGHNAALGKATSTLHNSKQSAQQGSSGKQQQSRGDAKNFDDWKDEGIFGED